MRHSRWFLPLSCIALVAFVVRQGASAGELKITRYGNIHEALAEGKHAGRIELGKVVSTPHCYAVGAMAKLKGEVTIVDGQIFFTHVTREGKAVTVRKPEKAKAAFLVLASVPKWVELKVEKDVPADQLEAFVRKQAKTAGLDPTKPFPFMLKGTFTSLKLHVINGTCPVRARLLEQPIPKGLKPFETAIPETRAVLVGFYDENGIGEITCHGDLVHLHAVVGTGKDRYTGHIEEVGLKAGTVLQLPAK